MPTVKKSSWKQNLEDFGKGLLFKSIFYICSSLLNV